MTLGGGRRDGWLVGKVTFVVGAADELTTGGMVVTVGVAVTMETGCLVEVGGGGLSGIVMGASLDVGDKVSVPDLEWGTGLKFVMEVGVSDCGC